MKWQQVCFFQNTRLRGYCEATDIRFIHEKNNGKNINKNGESSFVFVRNKKFHLHSSSFNFPHFFFLCCLKLGIIAYPLIIIWWRIFIESTRNVWDTYFVDNNIRISYRNNIWCVAYGYFVSPTMMCIFLFIFSSIVSKFATFLFIFRKK